jgi:hypothetical protein
VVYATRIRSGHGWDAAIVHSEFSSNKSSGKQYDSTLSNIIQLTCLMRTRQVPWEEGSHLHRGLSASHTPSSTFFFLSRKRKKLLKVFLFDQCASFRKICKTGDMSDLETFTKLVHPSNKSLLLIGFFQDNFGIKLSEGLNDNE